MNTDAFQNLYKLTRGSKSATLVVDAQNLFNEGDFKSSFQRLKDARESYATKYSRFLKEDISKGQTAGPDAGQQTQAKTRTRGSEKQAYPDRDQQKKNKKREKIFEAMNAFNLLIAKLEKRSTKTEKPITPNQKDFESEQRRHEPAEKETKGHTSLTASRQPSVEQSPAEQINVESGASNDCIGMTDEELKSLFDQHHDGEKISSEWLRNYFHLSPVASPSDLKSKTIYFIDGKRVSVLVRIDAFDLASTTASTNISLHSVLDNRPIKPIPLKALLDFGSDQRLHRLSALKSVNEKELATGIPEEHERNTESPDAGETKHPSQQNILDLGSFSQLMTSAQRCGLVPNADQIGFVRDKEFRQGKYDKAFQSIDMMHNRFLADAGQRLARLSREDVDIAAGRIKISPRELQAKRSRDRMQTQEVDRAKRRFQVVLEGLRILMNFEQTQ